MGFHVELTEEETRCLHRYFERVDETEDLSFHNPAEYRAFQRIARQVCEAGKAALKSNRDRLVHMARRVVGRGFRGDARGPGVNGRIARQITAKSASRFAPTTMQSFHDECDTTFESRAEAVALDCVAGFEAGDIEKVIALFSIDARVVSPFLGCLTAREFLPKVIGTPGSARLTLHDVLTNIEGRPQARGYFLYDGWQAVVRADTSVERGGVFNYVLNIDRAARSIQSMIVL